MLVWWYNFLKFKFMNLLFTFRVSGVFSNHQIKEGNVMAEVKKNSCMSVGIPCGLFADISTFLSSHTVTVSSENCVVFPGFCDVHVHFREPGFSYKETIKTTQFSEETVTV